jgi:hypothetical protein
MGALLYFYSNKNIVGSALAIVALGAYFGGVIHDFWWEIVAGSYAIGALLVPNQRGLHAASMENSLTPEQVAAFLTKLMTRIERSVPADAFALVQSVVGSIDGILPMLAAKAAQIPSEDVFVIRQTALHFLPETLDGYLKLPAAFRDVQPLQDGKTAKVLLVEQLTVLDGKMREIAKNLVANDAQALVANGAFLREKFEPVDFLRAVDD